MTSLGGKQNVQLEQLQAELIAAGIPVPYGLTRHGDALFTHAANGKQIDLPAQAVTVINAHTPSTTLRDRIIAVAQTAVGVSLDNLTQTQRLSLVAALLYRAGALEEATLKVKPLDTWALPPTIVPPPLV